MRLVSNILGTDTSAYPDPTRGGTAQLDAHNQFVPLPTFKFSPETIGERTPLAVGPHRSTSERSIVHQPAGTDNSPRLPEQPAAFATNDERRTETAVKAALEPQNPAEPIEIIRQQSSPATGATTNNHLNELNPNKAHRPDPPPSSRANANIPIRWKIRGGYKRHSRSAGRRSTAWLGSERSEGSLRSLRNSTECTLAKVANNWKERSTQTGHVLHMFGLPLHRREKLLTN